MQFKSNDVTCCFPVKQQSFRLRLRTTDPTAFLFPETSLPSIIASTRKRHTDFQTSDIQQKNSGANVLLKIFDVPNTVKECYHSGSNQKPLAVDVTHVSGVHSSGRLYSRMADVHVIHKKTEAKIAL